MVQIAAQCQKNLDSAVAIKESGDTKYCNYNCAFTNYLLNVYKYMYLKINLSKQIFLFLYATQYQLSLTFSLEVCPTNGVALIDRSEIPMYKNVHVALYC